MQSRLGAASGRDAFRDESSGTRRGHGAIQAMVWSKKHIYVHVKWCVVYIILSFSSVIAVIHPQGSANGPKHAGNCNAHGFWARMVATSGTFVAYPCTTKATSSWMNTRTSWRARWWANGGTSLNKQAQRPEALSSSLRASLCWIAWRLAMASWSFLAIFKCYIFKVWGANSYRVKRIQTLNK